jgi:hypothetical protein
MHRYYFDMREGDEIAPDEEGMELRTIEAVQRSGPHARRHGKGCDVEPPHGRRGVPDVNRGQKRRRPGIAGEVYVRGSPA